MKGYAELKQIRRYVNRLASLYNNNRVDSAEFNGLIELIVSDSKNREVARLAMDEFSKRKTRHLKKRMGFDEFKAYREKLIRDSMIGINK